MPVRRVHGVRVVEGLLRRPFGLAALRVEVAGYAAEAAAARTLYPLLRRADVEPFLAELLPELADDPGHLTPPPARAARRYVLPRALGGAIVGGAACLIFPVVAWWPLLLAPLAALDGWLDYRAAGWRLRDGRLAMSSRTLAWSTLLAPAARLQEHAIAQTPLQRRAGLADVQVAVGKAGGAQRAAPGGRRRRRAVGAVAAARANVNGGWVGSGFGRRRAVNRVSLGQLRLQRDGCRIGRATVPLPAAAPEPLPSSRR